MVKLLFWVLFPLVTLAGLAMFRNSRAVGESFFFGMRRWPMGNRPTFVAKPSIFDRDRSDEETRSDMARFLGFGMMIVGLGGLLIMIILG